jgi:hypothetical protein
LLLVGSPMPDRSKVITQTKRDALALQVGGWGLVEVLTTPLRKNTHVKKHIWARCFLWRQNIFPEVNYSPARISGGGECL